MKVPSTTNYGTIIAQGRTYFSMPWISDRWPRNPDPHRSIWIEVRIRSPDSLQAADPRNRSSIPQASSASSWPLAGDEGRAARGRRAGGRPGGKGWQGGGALGGAWGRRGWRRRRGRAGRRGELSLVGSERGRGCSWVGWPKPYLCLAVFLTDTRVAVHQPTIRRFSSALPGIYILVPPCCASVQLALSLDLSRALSPLLSCVGVATSEPHTRICTWFRKDYITGSRRICAWCSVLF